MLTYLIIYLHAVLNVLFMFIILILAHFIQKYYNSYVAIMNACTNCNLNFELYAHVGN